MTSKNKIGTANHQRKGVKSNAHAGKQFERQVGRHFKNTGLELDENFRVSIGINGSPKPHRYDLGSLKENLVVECKSHRWTSSDKIPVAKMTTWNEVMLLFHGTPKRFKKILVVLRDYSKKRKITLGQYYLKINGHLIPKGVQIWEYDVKKDQMLVLKK
jgi:hypothetical protein